MSIGRNKSGAAQSVRGERFQEWQTAKPACPRMYRGRRSFCYLLISRIIA